MAQDIIENILKGLQIHQQKILRQQELQIERDRADAQKKQHEDQIKLEQDKLKQEHEQFQANHAVVASQAAAAMVQAKQAINQGIMQGIPVDNDTQTPVLTPGMQQQTQATPGTSYDTTNVGSGGSDPNILGNLPQKNVVPTLDTLSIQHSIPIGDKTHNVTLPTPDQFAQQQAARKRILMAPEEEAKTRESLALQASKNAEEEQKKKADFERDIVLKIYEAKKAEEHEKAETARNDARIAGEYAREKLRNGSSNIDLGPYAQQGYNGTMTQEEIMKLPLKGPDKMGILTAITKNGGRVLTNKEQATMQDFGVISSTVPKLDRALQLLNDHSFKVRTPGTNEYREFNEIIGQLELVLPTVARAVGDRSKLSNMQMELVQGGFIPKTGLISNDYDNNVRRRNDFVKLMNDMLDNRVPGVKPSQRELFKENYNIKDMHPHIAPSGSKTTTPTGLTPEAIQKLKEFGQYKEGQ